MPGDPATPGSITWVGLDRRLKCSTNGCVVSIRCPPVLFPFDVAFHPCGLRSTSSFPSRARGSISDASIFPSDEPRLSLPLHVALLVPPLSNRDHFGFERGFLSGSKGNPPPSTNDEGVRVKKSVKKRKTRERVRVVLSLSCCVVCCVVCGGEGFGHAMGCSASAVAKEEEEEEKKQQNEKETYQVMPPGRGAAGQSVYNQDGWNEEQTNDARQGMETTAAGRSVYGRNEYQAYVEMEMKVETTCTISVKTMAEELSFQATKTKTVHQKLPWVFDHVLLQLDRNLYRTLFHECRCTMPSLVYGDGGIRASSGLAKGSKPVNQDSILTWTNFHQAIGLEHPEGLHLFGVFDGHGPMGHHVSQIARDMLPLVLAQEVKSSNTVLITEVPEEGKEMSKSTHAGLNEYAWDMILPDAMEKVDAVFSHEYVATLNTREMNVDARCSGSTASLIVVEGRKLVLASLGDSSTLLVKVKRKDKRGKFSCLSHSIMAKLHKPEHPIERHRIQAAGGIVDNAPNEPYINRLWPPSFTTALNGHGCLEAPGVAISRAFGDVVLKKYGMSNVPDVYVQYLDHDPEDDEGYIVVIGTDGLWDVITVEEVVYKISKCGKDNIAEHLVQIAQGRWRARYAGMMADDVGVVCVHIP